MRAHIPAQFAEKHNGGGMLEVRISDRKQSDSPLAASRLSHFCRTRCRVEPAPVIDDRSRRRTACENSREGCSASRGGQDPIYLATDSPIGKGGGRVAGRGHELASHAGSRLIFHARSVATQTRRGSRLVKSFRLSGLKDQWPVPREQRFVQSSGITPIKAAGTETEEQRPGPRLMGIQTPSLAFPVQSALFRFEQ
jgi:hypothetical protein